jgi:arginine/lysine/ornithine decarboxylase
MHTPIRDFLRNYNPVERCHTPGHKGTAGLSDITEVDGAVSIIRESERNAAKLFGAERSLFSTSGSTLAIFAMLSPFAATRITAIRGAHRSLIDAAILLDLQVDWVTCGDSPTFAISPDSSAFFMTSIDYYGKQTPVPTALPVPILVDNAHGAFRVFTQDHPIRLGAAMCADSAHKTLPAMTGAAYLHISEIGERFAAAATAAMSLFGTTSPSYPILESLDLCNRHISEEKHTAESAFDAVARLKSDLRDCGCSLRETDPLRVTIDTADFGYSGHDFAAELANRGVISEMHDSRCVILLFSTITTSANTTRVLEAVRGIPRKPAIAEFSAIAASHAEPPQVVMSPRAAYFSDKTTIPTTQAVGEVCAGVHVTIPPCVPLIMPGEVFSAEIAAVLAELGLREVDVVVTP